MKKIGSNKRKGFTLVEILVVVVILGMLAAIIIPNVVGQTDEARRTLAATQIKEIENTLDIYRLHNGFYPTTEQGLEALVTKPTTNPQPKKYTEGGYMKKVPLDPWGNPFIYRSPGDKGLVDIICCGPDGEESTGNNITNHDI
ncbi:MAG: type II secretion system major pseudopilin GspG [Synergistaceae bacterium]|nr:type II secretion system major pseudopilin GspG [Synergistaceae bacterium]